MKVTYMEHSGFLLETKDACFLFDYYKGKIPKMEQNKAIVVFVSHKHYDHYNAEIFNLIKEYPKIQYILEKDIPVKRHISSFEKQGLDLESHITAIKKNMTFTFSLSNGKALQVTTLKSTDIGVAYLLRYDGKTYYHAGDLNLWIWEGETEQYNESMGKAYYRQLEKLRDMAIDVAFVPLDPRQEKDAFKGMESFIQYTRTKRIFPMHFWGNYDIISEFLEKHPEWEQQVIKIHQSGECFELSEEDDYEI